MTEIALHLQRQATHTARGVARTIAEIGVGGVVVVDEILAAERERDGETGGGRGVDSSPANIRIAVEGSLREACCRLSERERLMLVMRYERRLKVGEIAALLHVHSSNVTRQLERSCERLRRRVLHMLNQKYQLTRCEIDECVRDLFENPSYSLLALLQEAPPGSDARRRDVAP